MALSEQQVSLVKGMLLRGDKQHDIAAYFGVNGGRVAEVATGTKYAETPPAPTSELPPSGEYSRWLHEMANIPVHVLAKIAQMCERRGTAWLIELIEEAEANA